MFHLAYKSLIIKHLSGFSWDRVNIPTSSCRGLDLVEVCW